MQNGQLYFSDPEKSDIIALSSEIRDLREEVILLKEKIEDTTFYRKMNYPIIEIFG